MDATSYDMTTVGPAWPPAVMTAVVDHVCVLVDVPEFTHLLVVAFHASVFASGINVSVSL